MPVRQDWINSRPKNFTKRFPKNPTLKAIAAASEVFSKRLKARFGIAFSVMHYPMFEEVWTRTGFLVGEPIISMERDSPSDMVAGLTILEKLKADMKEHSYPYALYSTGQAVHTTGMTPKEIVEGLQYLIEQGLSWPHVNRRGIYTMATFTRFPLPSQT